jgi:hypothetical protein
VPVLGDWLPVAETPNTTEPAAPKPDLVAEAEAAAIRARVYAETEALRIAAEAEADAIRTKAEKTAEAEAERLRILNERNAMKLERDRAAHEAHLEEVQRERDEAARRAEAATNAEAEAAQVEADAAASVDQSSKVWKWAALGFAIACGIVALPVQISAFWNPQAPWLAGAPVFLEGGAWVVLAGAAAAVAAHRPHWHYRLIAWSLAFVAAGVNLWHGLNAFDTATACATAFASLAGPGVWDLHEHGRIRKRDGALTWRERKAAKKAAKKQAAERAAQEQREAAREQARQQAMEAAAEQLAGQREQEFPDEWKYALKLAVAMGETSVTDVVWARAWDDLHAAKPGVTANSISARNAAAARMSRVLERDPANTPRKGASPQRGAHLPPTANKSRPKPVPPRRKRGDSAPFHPAAKRLAAETARQAMTVRLDANDR